MIEGITAGTIMRGGEHHNPIWQEVASVLHADSGKVEGMGGCRLIFPLQTTLADLRNRTRDCYGSQKAVLWMDQLRWKAD
ncbi:hypothetical protein HED49_22815 [Ochrobactrum daejeonense]|nr:hypothetical protein [Brucella daejeonensis]